MVIEKYAHTKMCSNVHATLFIIAKRWEQPKHPSTNEWINTMWNVHIVGYYSAKKGNEVLLHATTLMNLEGILLKETNHCRLHIVLVHLYEIYKDRKWISDCVGLGGNQEWLLRGMAFIWVWWKCSKIVAVVVQLWI